jgi:N-acetylmuramoyl-L-alanine amidase
VETAFISNPDEEKRLNDPSYRLQVAQAIGKGIIDYFANYTPNTLLANR